MRFKFTIFTSAIISLLLITCTPVNKDLSIDLQSNVVKGELSDYFTVVSGNYKLEKIEKDWQNNDQYSLKIQIKRTENIFNFDAKDLASRGYFGLNCDLLDAQNVPLISKLKLRNYENKAFTTLKPGETEWAIFSFAVGDKLDINKIKKIEIGSFVDLNQSTKDISSDEITTSDETDCDKFIKEYNDFADSYIRIINKYKANNTDPDILNEYTNAAQKATELETQAINCNSLKYANELMKISKKIAKAAQ